MMTRSPRLCVWRTQHFVRLNRFPSAPVFLCGLALVGFAGLANPHHAAAATWTVTNTDDDAAGGSCGGVCTLRDAIGTAAAGDTVDATGVAGTIVLTNGELPIDQDLTIAGPGANVLTVDGNYNSRVFEITAGTASITGLTAAYGNGTSGSVDNGGGLVIAARPLTAAHGNGTGGSIDATYGGGVLIDTGATLDLANCTVSGNYANNYGGGISNLGTATLANCTVNGNREYGLAGGGGIFNSGTATLLNTIVAGNEAFSPFGGGIDNTGTATLTNCTLTGNSVTQFGGGIFNSGTAALTNCTVSGNGADQSGGGIFINATATLLNTIVAGNSANSVDPDVVGRFASSGHNLIGDAGHARDATGFTATGDLVGGGVNPVIHAGLDPAGLADNGGPTLTIALEPGSRAIDAGDDKVLTANGGTLDFDQRGTGFPRLVGSHVDIGAFEAPVPAQTGSTLTVNTTDDHDDGTCGVADCTLREAINHTPADATINFAPSVTGAITLTNGELPIGQDLTIAGPGANVLTVDGNYAGRVFHVSGGTVAVSGLAIANGAAPGGTSGYGGGILIDSTSVTVALANCAVTGNRAYIGGGIADNAGSLTVAGCTFGNNIANGAAGAISNYAGPVALTNSTFVANSAPSGFGGAIYNYIDVTMNLTNCTLAGNSTDGFGGAIYNYGGPVNILNTIVAGNGAPGDPDVYGNFASSGHNLIGDVGDATGFTAPGDQAGTTAAPLAAGLDPNGLAANGGPTQTIALVAGSPALEAGDDSVLTANGGTLDFDQRGTGFPRLVGSHVDIGAFEAPVPAQTGSTLTVNTIDDHDDGTCGADDCTLREAINHAPSGATIDFASSVNGTITLTLGELSIGQDLTIAGPGANVLTVDGNQNSRVFEITAGTATITGLTIAHGNVGGIETAHGGGALIDDSAALALTNCIVSGSSAFDGGGVFAGDTTTLTLTNCTVTGNDAVSSNPGIDSAGGGIFSKGAATLADCTVSDNSNTGLFVSGAATLTNCTVSGNTAYAGGGIENGGQTTLTNCTVSGNSAAYEGGGIDSIGELTLTNCTVTNNAATIGGGIYRNVYGERPLLLNTIVAGNKASFEGPDIAGSYDSNGHNLIGDIGDSNGFAGDQVGGGANPVIDAGFDPNGLAANGGPTLTIALEPGSPAIDAGDDGVLGAPYNLATDQRDAGFPRKSGAHVDCGAFETRAPHIISVTPISGAVGSAVTIDGTTLTTPGRQPSIAFGGVAGTSMTSLSPTQINVRVPANAKTGFITLSNLAGQAQSATQFTVIAAPTIHDVAPSHGAVGVNVTIHGANLTNATTAVPTVRFGAIAAAGVKVISSGEVQAVVPPHAISAKISLDTSGGSALSPRIFIVDATADVGITAVASAVSIVHGDEVRIRLTVTNHGPSPATGVTVTDDLTSYLTYVSSTKPVHQNGRLLTFDLVTLPDGGSEGLTIVARGSKIGTVASRATVTANEADLTPANNSATASTNVTAAAGLSIRMTAPVAQPFGENLTYRITVTNHGPETATGVVVTDTLPAGVDIVSTSRPRTVVSGHKLGFALGDMYANISSVFTIVVSPQALGEIVNGAKVTGAAGDPDSADNAATAATTIAPSCDLAIANAVSAATAHVGDELVYTLTVTNHGPSPSAGVTVTDALPAGLALVSSAPRSSGSGSRLAYRLATIAKGARSTIKITVKATAPGQIANVATVSGANSDPVAADNTATARTSVTPASSDLVLTMTAAAPTVALGATLQYTITVANQGPDAAGGAIITNILPAGLAFVSANPEPTMHDGATWTYNLGALANGAHKGVVVTARATATGSIVNSAGVHGTGTDPNATNDMAAATVVCSNFTLVITQTQVPAIVKVGEQFTYNIEVINDGPNDAPDVHVSDVLPAGVVLVSSEPPPGTHQGSTLTYSLGNLAAGESADVALLCTSTVSGNLSNSVSAFSNATSTHSTVISTATFAIASGPGNVTPSVTVTAGGLFPFGAIPELVLEKGSAFAQYLTIKNVGTAALQGPITVAADGLTPGVTVANARGVTAAIAPVGSPYVYLNLGPNALAPGAQAVVELQFNSRVGSSFTYKARILAGPGAR